MVAMVLGRGHGTRLVDRARGGDRQAFGELVRRHDARLRGLAYKLLAGDQHRMDDAMQEAYVHAFRSLHRFRGESDIGTWLYRIVYNACIDEVRRGHRRPEPVDANAAVWSAPATGSDPEQMTVASDAVLRALAGLPDDQRATVILVDGEGFDNASAAKILGVPPGTVASRLSRARAAMRHAIGERDG